MSNIDITTKELRPMESLQYNSDPAKYKEAELHKWLLFKKDCKAYTNNMWVNNTCRVTDRDCHIDDCFATQLIKTIRGYF